MRDKLKCGDCGCNTFRLENAKAPGEHRFGGGGSVNELDYTKVAGYLLVICTKCGSETSVKAGPPALVAGGNLCGGWS